MMVPNEHNPDLVHDNILKLLDTLRKYNTHSET